MARQKRKQIAYTGWARAVLLDPLRLDANLISCGLARARVTMRAQTPLHTHSQGIILAHDHTGSMRLGGRTQERLARFGRERPIEGVTARAHPAPYAKRLALRLPLGGPLIGMHTSRPQSTSRVLRDE